ncbi:MAG: hypothetical protein LBQ32_08545 [Burkholderiaceae bacterium]|jgi:hypothetical protein|nr:hypothetical protein [Burkholderiaceae bacterium]
MNKSVAIDASQTRHHAAMHDILVIEVQLLHPQAERDATLALFAYMHRPHQPHEGADGRAGFEFR